MRRVAPFFQPGSDQIGPVNCADCGAGSLTVFYTSKEEEIHLCPPCFDSRVKRGLARHTTAGDS
jgi:hypothetical protein